MYDTLASATRRINWKLLAVAMAALIIVGGAAFVYFGHLTFRVAVGPKGGDGEKLFAALAQQMALDRPRIRLKLEPSRDAEEAMKILERGDFDFAITRADLTQPKNARVLMLLRRDPILMIARSDLKLESIAQLKGQAIGLVDNIGANKKILEQILGYYSVPIDTVRLIDISKGDVLEKIKSDNIVAVFAVAPMGHRSIRRALFALQNVGNGAPKFLGVNQAKAIQARYPSLCTMEILPGSLVAVPSLPTESIEPLCVSYYLVSHASIMNRVAAEIGRQILANKQKLAGATNYVVHIEAPDTEDGALPSPIHPGIAAYVNGEEEGIFDFLEGLYWKFWMLAAVLGPLFLVVRNLFRKPQANPSDELMHAIVRLLPEIMSAGSKEIGELAEKVDCLGNEALLKRQNGEISTEELQTISIAVSHARVMIDRRLHISTPAATGLH